MITPDNIPTQFMYASTAFPYTEMNSAYLKKMDEEEKIIAEKEDSDIKEFNDQQLKNGLKTGAGGSIGMVSAFSIPILISKSQEGFSSVPASDVLGFITLNIFCAGIGFAIGSVIGMKNSAPLQQTITLRRADRLDEKMRDISKRMQTYIKVLEEKEVNELEKAHIFFANRSMEYKTSKNNGQSTTILSQNNYLSMAQNRV